MVLILSCCQYCSSAFESKRDLHFHWSRQCHASHCECQNCVCAIRVEQDKFRQFRIYFNRSNLHVGIREIMNKHYPHIDLPRLDYNLSCSETKRAKLECMDIE